MIHHRFLSCLLFIACGVDIAPINEGALPCLQDDDCSQGTACYKRSLSQAS